jgi:Flp pilus assembly protein TadD
MRGFAYGCKNDLRNAILNHSKAIELDPNHGEAYKARAIAYFVARAYDQAWADVRACRRLGVEIPQQFVDMLSQASGHRE